MDRIITSPTMTGLHGRAWELDMAEARRNFGVDKDDSTVGVFCVEAPYGHPIWHSYMLSMIHLRPLVGQSRLPTINRPGATHEIMVFALDPERQREPFITAKDHPHLLRPANFVGQVIEASDDDAASLLRATVQDVIDGKLNPDTDYMKWWAERFGAFCLKPGWDAFASKLTVGDQEILIPMHPTAKEMN